jgi:hypothetical protein
MSLRDLQPNCAGSLGLKAIGIKFPGCINQFFTGNQRVISSFDKPIELSIGQCYFIACLQARGYVYAYQVRKVIR